MDKTRVELKPTELRSEIDPSLIDMEASLEMPDHKFLGQDRALRAIDFGLSIKSNGYNLYVAGMVGTGKTTAIMESVEKMAAGEPAPDDILYFYNFKNHDQPIGIKLPPGTGCELKTDMEEFIKEAQSSILKAFSSEEYERHKKEVTDRYESQKMKLNTDLTELARQKGLAIRQTLTGLAVVPIYGDRELSETEYDGLAAHQKEMIKNNQSEVYARIETTIKKVEEINREIKHKVKELDERIGVYSIGSLLDRLREKYGRFKPVLEHLDDIRKDILHNIDTFKKDTENQPAMPFMMPEKGKEEMMQKYKVNLLVDNCEAKRAPVVVEHNPTYYNLTGWVEYKAQLGVLTTDYTMIKAGAVHRANGGYLVIQASEILRDYIAYDTLKKILQYRKVKIENAYVRYGFAPTTGLKPEPVEVDIKVVLIGNPIYYYLLYMYDEDFKEIFRVKADFDTSAKKSHSLIGEYATMLRRRAHEEKLLPLERSGIAEIINYSTRLVSHKEKLSENLREVTDMMKEADAWARKAGASNIDAGYVKKAMEEKVYRSNMIEQKLQDMVRENVITIETQGYYPGQVNGLAVSSLGDYEFGMPSRITARTFVGKAGIVNIEREVRLSGPLHSKGVLILTGYLGEKFCQDKPLAVQASIGFEQQYDEIEGDSASSTELYSLLSSLSGLPLRQDVAVTGSVDQRGKVQAIGGVNQKIEGFYQICKIKGLTGTQGVMIPKSNVLHLMLKDEVVQAVKEGRFHIYPVETIDQGIEILTGVEAGTPNERGDYPEGSVNFRVNQRLKDYADISAAFGKEQAAKTEPAPARRFVTEDK
ncbi:MAG: Lon protease family protein [Deltaproteobacteria bacterium]